MLDTVRVPHNFFAMATVRPEVQSKIALFGGLAPVAYVGHCKSILLDLLAALELDKIFELFGFRQFLPGQTNRIMKYIIDPPVCHNFNGFCGLISDELFGPSKDLNASRYEVYYSESPADTSVKNMAHWAQGVRRDKWEMYDYGTKEKNMEYYGVPEPPLYYLANVTVPTALYSGGNDYLADPKDVERLVSELNPDILIDHIVIDDFAHCDFIWGMHANTLVYPDLLQKIQLYLGKGIIVN